MRAIKNRLLIQQIERFFGDQKNIPSHMLDFFYVVDETYCGYDRDIEEKKANEILLRKFSQAVQQTSASVVITNTKGEIEFVNPRFTEVTGYTLEEALGENPRILKSGEQSTEYYKTLWDTISAGNVWRGEFHNKRKNGELYWELASIAPIISEEGEIAHYLAVKDDITERKKAEADLNLIKEQAVTASKSKSEFLANMSHEIRTPLNGVVGFTDLLKNTPLTPLQKQYVDNANVSGLTLLAIVNDILDFSKIEAGMMELEIIKTDMYELIENSVDIVRYAADLKNIEILLNIDSNMPRYAMVDPVRIKQILANLMGNAIKFTDTGEVELKVSYKSINSTFGEFLISVRDTGIGISEEQKTKLFKAFSQGDTSTTRKFGGTGLGLTISDMIAQKMGSKIHFESAFGEGSTFYFSLKTEIELGDARINSDLALIHNCLIIDDNLNNQIILEHMMKRWGINCTSCNNGYDAFKKVERSKYDVIICDYNMPYIDGLETIRVIREDIKLTPDKQPIFLLHSSSDNSELQKQSDALGVRYCITKPVKQEQLFACLASIHEPKQNGLLSVELINGTYTSTDETKNSIKGVPIIMVAEDVSINILLIKALLSKIVPDAKIVDAINGTIALSKYQEIHPDIILMDVQMPEMDGQEVTRAIRELERGSGKHVPIIALTAGALKEEEQRCYEAGMDDFLTKPIEAKRLKMLLEKYLS